MRRALLITAVLVVSMTSVVFAAVNCDQQFGLDIAACSQSLNTLELSEKERAEAQKACVVDARAAKLACKSGASTCATNCKNTYTTSVTECQTTYDPGLCQSNVTCEVLMIQQRAVCLDTVVDTVAVCENGGGLTQVAACCTTCGDAYTASVTSACEQAYDPSVCGGGITCEQVILIQRSSCIAQTTPGFELDGDVLQTMDQASSVIVTCTNACLTP